MTLESKQAAMREQTSRGDTLSERRSAIAIKAHIEQAQRVSAERREALVRMVHEAGEGLHHELSRKALMRLAEIALSRRAQASVVTGACRTILTLLESQPRFRPQPTNPRIEEAVDRLIRGNKTPVKPGGVN